VQERIRWRVGRFGTRDEIAPAGILRLVSNGCAPAQGQSLRINRQRHIRHLV
jgi:hypothetical protein